MNPLGIRTWKWLALSIMVRPSPPVLGRGGHWKSFSGVGGVADVDGPGVLGVLKGPTGFGVEAVGTWGPCGRIGGWPVSTKNFLVIKKLSKSNFFNICNFTDRTFTFYGINERNYLVTDQVHYRQQLQSWKQICCTHAELSTFYIRIISTNYKLKLSVLQLHTNIII